MILYGYQCRECGQEYTSEIRGACLVTEAGQTIECHVCHAYPVKRKYSVAVHRPMHEHFNTSTGSLISSDRQFRDELKRKSEDQFLRTGIPADYVPADPAETRKAAEESGYAGLESTNRERVKKGLKPIRV